MKGLFNKEIKLKYF